MTKGMVLDTPCATGARSDGLRPFSLERSPKILATCLARHSKNTDLSSNLCPGTDSFGKLCFWQLLAKSCKMKVPKRVPEPADTSS